jgi:hypothetical protein
MNKSFTISDFWSRVVISDGCWEWIGKTDGEGYGRFGASSRAHRYSYENSVGLIPPGLVLDHLCLNPICVRPDHLEAVTIAENTFRGNAPSIINRNKDTCPKGHRFDESNTYRYKTRRECRRCVCDRQSAYQRRKRCSS